MVVKAQMIRLTPLLVVAALAAAPAVALTHVGGAPITGEPAVRVYDASNPATPVLLDETEALARSAAYVASHDALFVATGSDVRRYDRRDLGRPASASWTAAGPVFGIADGPERGLVFVLDAQALTLVRFPDAGEPASIWTMPYDGAAMPANPGRVIVRSADQLFVADASLPGLRVISIETITAPVTVATYTSIDGPIHDLTLWGTRMVLAVDDAFVVLDVTRGEHPAFRRLGSYGTVHRAGTVDANSRHAVVADGADLLVIDIDPASESFLGAPQASWAASSDVRAVRIDMDDRAYVLTQGSYEIFELGAFGGR